MNGFSKLINAEKLIANGVWQSPEYPAPPPSMAQVMQEYLLGMFESSARNWDRHVTITTWDLTA